MKTYFNLFLAVWMLYAPTVCLALPPNVFFRRSTTGGLPPVVVNTATFNGSSYLRASGTGAGGLTPGTSFTASFWIRVTGTGAAYHAFSIANTAGSSRLIISWSSGQMRFRGWNSSSVAVADLLGSQVLSTNTWYHVYWCVNTTSSALTKLYINGVEDTSLTETVLSGTMDLNSTGGYRFTVAASGAGAPTQLLVGSLAELWMNDSYLDTVNAFFAGGAPVALGTNGELPTGGTPTFYFSSNGSGNNWRNMGTAGGTAPSFTVNRTITSTTPPP